MGAMLGRKMAIAWLRRKAENFSLGVLIVLIAFYMHVIFH